MRVGLIILLKVNNRLQNGFLGLFTLHVLAIRTVWIGALTDRAFPWRCIFAVFITCEKWPDVAPGGGCVSSAVEKN